MADVAGTGPTISLLSGQGAWLHWQCWLPLSGHGSSRLYITMHDNRVYNERSM